MISPSIFMFTLRLCHLYIIIHFSLAIATVDCPSLGSKVLRTLFMQRRPQHIKLVEQAGGVGNTLLPTLKIVGV